MDMEIETIRLNALQLVTRDHSGWPVAEQIKAASDFTAFITHGANQGGTKLMPQPRSKGGCLLDADDVK